MTLRLVHYNHGDGQHSPAIADIEGDTSSHTVVFPIQENADGWDDPVHHVFHEVKEGEGAGTFSA